MSEKKFASYSSKNPKLGSISTNPKFGSTSSPTKKFGSVSNRDAKEKKEKEKEKEKIKDKDDTHPDTLPEDYFTISKLISRARNGTVTKEVNPLLEMMKVEIRENRLEAIREALDRGINN